MDTEHSCMYVLMQLWIIALLLKDVHTTDCADVSAFVHKRIGLAGPYIWKGKAQHITTCARMCVSRKPCQSINYDLTTKVCELNPGTIDDTPTKTGTTLVYTSFSWWGGNFDPHCYSRPCGDDEVCIPGVLNAAATAGSCSFTCMPAGRKVCPIPEFGLSGGRYVGDVNDFTCGHGLAGSDTATCLSTGEWDKDINPECKEIHGHRCSSDKLCSSINAVCQYDNCACPSYLEYDSDKLMCVCPSPPSAVSATVTLSEDGSTATYACEEGYSPKPSSGENTRTCSESTGWQPANNYECYTCGEPPSISGATLSALADDGTRTYTCGPDPIRQKLNTDSGTIRCLDTGSWESTNFKCAGFRFKLDATDPDRQFTNTKIGYLEVYNNGWHSACTSEWTWRQTKIVCEREGYMFAGSFHEDWYDEKDNHKDALPDNQNSYKVKDLTCEDDQAGNSLCSYNTDNCNHDQDMVITCFNYTDAEPDVMLDVDDRLFVFFNGNKKPLCHKHWSDSETEITCKTLNPNWSKNGDNDFQDSNFDAFAKNTDCDGSEPHLFFCQNQGWGYGDDCHNDKFVEIECQGDGWGEGGAGTTPGADYA